MPVKKIEDTTIEFLSDWRKRMREQQKRNTLMFIGALFCTILIGIIAFSVFQNRNYQRIVNQNTNYIQDSAIQETNQIERQMEQTVVLVKNFAHRYEQLTGFMPDATALERLKVLENKEIFDRIAYVSADGMDESAEGSADVSDRSYFQDAMQGNSGWAYIERSRVTGKPTVVFYAPVHHGEEIVGMLGGFFSQDRLDDIFSYEFFNYAPRTYLLRKDGTVIANSLDQEISDNILDRLSTERFLGQVSYQDVLDTLEDADRTTVTFSFMENNRTSVAVIVQFQRHDWLVLSVLPYDITSRMLVKANRAGVLLVVMISIAIILLTAVLLLAYRRANGRFQREMGAAVSGYEAARRHEEQQYDIILSLVNVYTSVYLVELEKQTYRRVKEANSASLVISDEGLWKDGIGTYIERFVEDAYKEEMRTFADPSTFNHRMENMKRLTMEYQKVDRKWRRAIIIPIDQGEGEEEAYSSFVFAVQEIDREKEKELETKKALEEAYAAAQLASNAKTVFLSNMSHDIRTPMNAIIGMTAIAASSLDNPTKVSDCLKKITLSSRHLLGLVNEILDMSKIESGKVELCEEEFNLSDLIDDMVSLHKPLIKDKDHSLSVVIRNVTHEKVIGDSTRLQQVLTNLLSNSIKYTPNGGKLEIIVSEKETNKPTIGWYEVVIRDNGIGMSEEFQKKIFDPFARAEDSRINAIQGTGLGMAIAKNIIRMMDGNIEVESELNKGSTFTVSFVLRLQTGQDIQYENFVNLPVLVVDDDEIACESTAAMLDSLKMDSEWVTSPHEAIDKTVARHEKNDDYYAVIVDWKMPEMNGIEVTREIRKRVGDEVPIVIISAYDWIDIEQEAREAGANAFLSKPLFKSKVVSVFSELMGMEPFGEVDNTSDDTLDSADFKGKRVLVAEDNEMNREIATELLSMIGFEVETAEDGKLCLDRFMEVEKGYYDLVLMDVQMPVMNGLDAARAIRKCSHPDAKTIPIIAMTANAFSSDVRAAIDAGMNDHIAKPIDIGHVKKVLNSYLNK